MTHAVLDLLEACYPSKLQDLPIRAAPGSSQRKRAIKIVTWVDEALERRTWGGEEIGEKIMRRSPEEILREGHICFAAPCFDLTSVTAEILQATGIPPTIVLSRMKRFLQPTGLQVGIEVELDGVPHIIGFGITSKRCEMGRYEITGPRKLVHRRALQGETFRRSHLFLFGIDSFFDIPALLAGYDPHRHLARFRRMQRPGRLRRARRRAARKARQARPGQIPSPGRWAG